MLYFDHSWEQGEKILGLLAGPLNITFVWDFFVVKLLKDFVYSRDLRERMEYLFYGLSISKMLFIPLLIDRFW